MTRGKNRPTPGSSPEPLGCDRHVMWALRRGKREIYVARTRRRRRRAHMRLSAAEEETNAANFGTFASSLIRLLVIAFICFGSCDWQPLQDALSPWTPPPVICHLSPDILDH